MTTAPAHEDSAVVRYVITKKSKDDDMRTLADPRQGRYTYATVEEAQERLDAIRNGNNAATFERFFPNAEVRPVKCWPVHFDPKTCWFDDAENAEEVR